MNRIDMGTRPHASRRNTGMSAIGIAAWAFALVGLLAGIGGVR